MPRILPSDLQARQPRDGMRLICFQACLTFFESTYMLWQVGQKFDVGWLRIRTGNLLGCRDLRGLGIHDLLPNVALIIRLRVGLSQRPLYSPTCVLRSGHTRGGRLAMNLLTTRLLFC